MWCLSSALGLLLAASPAWTQSNDTLHEPLLDNDYIHDANNPLDNFTWQEKKEEEQEAPTPTAQPANQSTTSGCVTTEDRRAAWFSKTAVPGTPCVFGVDDRDEGKHCILDEEDGFGAYGWCWTRKDKLEWGSCSDKCPLFGQAKKLHLKIQNATAQMAKWQKLIATAAAIPDPDAAKEPADDKAAANAGPDAAKKPAGKKAQAKKKKKEDAKAAMVAAKAAGESLKALSDLSSNAMASPSKVPAALLARGERPRQAKPILLKDLFRLAAQHEKADTLKPVAALSLFARRSELSRHHTKAPVRIVVPKGSEL